jgi:UDP-2,3-diacylglucosamine pyrophosphatase LpxH
MKVFISDLHLGDGSKTDDFSRDKEFLEFLEFAEAQAQELIILGDLLELWQADLDRILFRHSEVIKKLLSLRSKIKVTYVVGNHDYIPFVRFIDSGFGICLEYRDSKSAIVAEHGHKYDIFNRYKNPLKSIKWPAGKHFAKAVAGLERWLHPDIDIWTKNTIERMDEFFREAVFIRNKITPTAIDYIKRGGHFAEFQEAVKNHIKQGARIVIFGHTHKAQLKSMDGGIYANSGTWVDGEIPTYIVYLDDKIELRQALNHKVIEEVRLNQN